jgi:hypothetical protein
LTKTSTVPNQTCSAPSTKRQACDDAAEGAAGHPFPTRGAVRAGRVLTRFGLARQSALDETRVCADIERRLLQPRDDAKAGCAKDLPSFGRGNGGPPNRGPEVAREARKATASTPR